MIYEKVDRNKIALIHAAKAEIKMTEDNYRTVLKSRFNVTTSKDLTIPQLKAFIKKQTGQEKQLGRLLVKEAQDVINGLDKMIDWKNKGKKTW